jgi:hypothetical protein
MMALSIGGHVSTASDVLHQALLAAIIHHVLAKKMIAN